MTDQPMTEDRRAEIHEALDSIEGRLVSVAHGIPVAELRTVLELSRLAIRHEELRRQAEAVCERRTAEREDARHGMMVARAERDAAQLKIDELEDTLAATLENWEAYAAELGPEPEACECDERHCPGTKPIDDTPIPPPAPGECVECRAEPGSTHHPNCSVPGGEL